MVNIGRLYKTEIIALICSMSCIITVCLISSLYLLFQFNKSITKPVSDIETKIQTIELANKNIDVYRTGGCGAASCPYTLKLYSVKGDEKELIYQSEYGISKFEVLKLEKDILEIKFYCTYKPDNHCQNYTKSLNISED